MNGPVPQRTSWYVLGMLAGVLLGPVALTGIALVDHVQRTGTRSEFWGDFVSVPAGVVLGLLLGWADAYVLHRVIPAEPPGAVDSDRIATPASSLPRRGDRLFRDLLLVAGTLFLDLVVLLLVWLVIARVAYPG
jgi:hypothetical protein